MKETNYLVGEKGKIQENQLGMFVEDLNSVESKCIAIRSHKIIESRERSN